MLSESPLNIPFGTPKPVIRQVYRQQSGVWLCFDIRPPHTDNPMLKCWHVSTIQQLNPGENLMDMQSVTQKLAAQSITIRQMTFALGIFDMVALGDKSFVVAQVEAAGYEVLQMPAAAEKQTDQGTITVLQFKLPAQQNMVDSYITVIRRIDGAAHVQQGKIISISNLIEDRVFLAFKDGKAAWYDLSAAITPEPYESLYSVESRYGVRLGDDWLQARWDWIQEENEIAQWVSKTNGLALKVDDAYREDVIDGGVAENVSIEVKNALDEFVQAASGGKHETLESVLNTDQDDETLTDEEAARLEAAWAAKVEQEEIASLASPDGAQPTDLDDYVASLEDNDITLEEFTELSFDRVETYNWVTMYGDISVVYTPTGSHWDVDFTMNIDTPHWQNFYTYHCCTEHDEWDDTPEHVQNMLRWFRFPPHDDDFANDRIMNFEYELSQIIIERLEAEITQLKQRGTIVPARGAGQIVSSIDVIYKGQSGVMETRFIPKSSPSRTRVRDVITVPKTIFTPEELELVPSGGEVQMTSAEAARAFARGEITGEQYRQISNAQVQDTFVSAMMQRRAVTHD